MTALPIKPSTPPGTPQGAQPLLGGNGAQVWARARIVSLVRAVQQLVAMAVSNSLAAPVEPQDGMVRLSRWPWWPVAAQSADAWVYYDMAGGVWRLLSTSPTTTH